MGCDDCVSMKALIEFSIIWRRYADFSERVYFNVMGFTLATHFENSRKERASFFFFKLDFEDAKSSVALEIYTGSKVLMNV